MAFCKCYYSQAKTLSKRKIKKSKKLGDRKKCDWRREKNEGKNMGNREKVRERRRQEGLDQLRRNMELQDNPYDEMSWDDKRRHAVFLYTKKMQVGKIFFIG